MNRVLRYIAILLAVVVVTTGIVVLVTKLIYRHKKHSILELPRPGSPSHSTERFGFPDTYTISGVIHLPLDDIHEPFHAWYSRGNRMSRIDYYYGKNVYPCHQHNHYRHYH